MKPRTVGLSKKLVADLLTSAVAFAVAYFGASLDPTVSAGVAKAIGFLAGYIAPANEVEVRDETGLSLVEVLVVLLVLLVVLYAFGVLR